MRSPQLTAVAAVLTLMAATACSAPREAMPAVEIVSPAAGDTAAGEILVRLGVTGARVVVADGARREGEGHHHVFVDVDPTPTDSVIPRTTGVYHLGTGADTIRLTALTPGNHRLIAVFAWGDHVPNTAVRSDTVSFVVR